MIILVYKLPCTGFLEWTHGLSLTMTATIMQLKIYKEARDDSHQLEMDAMHFWL